MGAGRSLEFRTEPTGTTCYLESQPVYPGQDLELLLEGKLWLLGRFEWTSNIDERPRLHVACGGAWEEMDDPESSTYPIPPEISFTIPMDALLRRPKHDARSQRPPQPRA